jgi:ornithine cyclodeaminase
MIILNQEEVQTLLDLDLLVELLEPAMAELSAGQVSMPQRILAFSHKAKGLLGAMPVCLPERELLSTKLVTVFSQNGQVNLPTHQAVILLFDVNEGTPLALMDGTHITAARTAAGSALATKLLARPEAEVLAIVGTGVQARAHARAIPRVRPIRELRVWGRNEQKAAALAREMGSELDIPAHTCGSFQELAAGADVICATTDAPQPVVFGQWLEPGVHVNSVGLNVNGRELDDAVVTRSSIFVELREAALTPSAGGANDLTWPIEAGTISESDILAEIGELVLGQHEGRTSDEQITLYKSVGVAVQDAVAAGLVMQVAEEAGVGTQVEL